MLFMIMIIAPRNKKRTIFSVILDDTILFAYYSRLFTFTLYGCARRRSNLSYCAGLALGCLVWLRLAEAGGGEFSSSHRMLLLVFCSEILDLS